MLIFMQKYFKFCIPRLKTPQPVLPYLPLIGNYTPFTERLFTIQLLLSISFDKVGSEYLHINTLYVTNQLHMNSTFICTSFSLAIQSTNYVLRSLEYHVDPNPMSRCRFLKYKLTRSCSHNRERLLQTINLNITYYHLLVPTSP